MLSSHISTLANIDTELLSYLCLVYYCFFRPVSSGYPINLYKMFCIDIILYRYYRYHYNRYYPLLLLPYSPYKGGYANDNTSGHRIRAIYRLGNLSEMGDQHERQLFWAASWVHFFNWRCSFYSFLRANRALPASYDMIE